MGLKFANNVIPISKTDDGSTTDAYVAVSEWECLGYNNKNILIKNTGLNGMTYSVTLYLYSGSDASYAFLADATLASGASDVIELEKQYAKIVITVKSTVPASHTTYQIDFSGGC
jgi:hypothetical protein